MPGTSKDPSIAQMRKVLQEVRRTAESNAGTPQSWKSPPRTQAEQTKQTLAALNIMSGAFSENTKGNVFKSGPNGLVAVPTLDNMMLTHVVPPDQVLAVIEDVFGGSPGTQELADFAASVKGFRQDWERINTALSREIQGPDATPTTLAALSDAEGLIASPIGPSSWKVTMLDTRNDTIDNNYSARGFANYVVDTISIPLMNHTPAEAAKVINFAANAIGAFRAIVAKIAPPRPGAVGVTVKPLENFRSFWGDAANAATRADVFDGVDDGQQNEVNDG